MNFILRSKLSWVVLFSVVLTTSCSDSESPGWHLSEPLVDPLPPDARELLVFIDGTHDVELLDPDTGAVTTLIDEGNVTGLRAAPVGGDGVLMIATRVPTAAPPPDDRRDEVVIFDASNGDRLASVSIREPDWESCSPVDFAGSGRVSSRTFWFMTVKRNVCEGDPGDRQRLHVIDADAGETAVHSIPYRTRVLAPVNDGAGLFVMRPSTTDEWVAGTLDVETGESELGDPFELFQATEPFLLAGGPSVFAMGGLSDDVDLVRARSSGESEIVTTFTNRGHGYLLSRTVSGDVFARLDDGVFRVSDGDAERVRAAPTEPSTQVAVSPAGTYIVEASADRLTVASPTGDTSRSLGSDQTEPWYQPDTGCFHGAGPVRVAPNSSAFVISTWDGPIDGACPDVEGAPPVEPRPGSWLVNPSDLSHVVLDDVGPAPPAFSPSGERLAYATSGSDDCVALALRSTAEPDRERIVAEDECGVSGAPYWVVVHP